MDIKQLNLFSVIAKFGSFSKAAVMLSVAQPALSRHIKALEGELGVKLLYRNGRGIVLTDAGERLRHYADTILDTAARAKTDIKELQKNPRGSVIIAMPPSVGSILTVPLIQRFRSKYPNIVLRLVEGFSGHLLEWLLMGKIDMAVLYNAPRMSNVQREPLLRDELFLLGPYDDPCGLPAGPVPARKLIELPMILPAGPHGMRLLIDQVLGKAGIKPNVEIEVDAMPSTLNLVERGIGYTILSYSTVHHLVEAKRIKAWPMVRPQITRELVLATSTQRPLTRATTALAEEVHKQIRELVRTGQWHPRRPS